MKRFALPLLIFAVLVAFLGFGLRGNPRLVPSPLIDQLAPAFALPSLTETSRQIRSEAMAGQPYILNVWASWCGACRQEHPVLMAYAQRSSVPIYGLNYKDRRTDALLWLQRHGNPYADTLFDAQGRLGIDFGVYGVPETFIVDRQGRVRFKHVGPLTQQVLQETIEPLILKLQGERA